MKLITRLARAAMAEKRWYEQYAKTESSWESASVWTSDKRTKRQIHELLVSFGSNPSAEDVNSAIGNTSWTDCNCDECGKSVESLVQIGEEPNYESCTAEVCFPCLKKALKLK